MPASAGQRLLWLLDRYRGQGGALNCPMACRIRGPLDVEALGAAIDHLTYRHESLRTTFAGQSRKLTQLINAARPVPVTYADLSAASDPGAAAGEAMLADLRTRIDPARWPSRVTLWKLAADEHVLCVNLHHLVTDSWSCAVLFRELGPVLDRCLGGNAPLAPVGWQYREWADWQARLLDGPQAAVHRDYWLDQLAGMSLAPIPLTPRGADLEGRRASVREDIGPDVADRLRALARTHQTTLFAVMLSVFYALLARLTGARDLAVGSMFANRSKPEVAGTVGYLASLLVLRVRLPDRPSFEDVIRQAHATVSGALAHQDLPYHLLSQARAPAQPARVDDVVFQMLAEPIDQITRVGELEIEGVVPDVVGRFDVEFALMAGPDGCAAKLYFARDRLDPGWARHFIAAYAVLAAAVAAAPDAPLATLDAGPALAAAP